MQRWLDEPYTTALKLSESINSLDWHTLYGSQLGFYNLIEAGLADGGGVDGLDHINELRYVRDELNG